MRPLDIVDARAESVCEYGPQDRSGVAYREPHVRQRQELWTHEILPAEEKERVDVVAVVEVFCAALLYPALCIPLSPSLSVSSGTLL